jgi:hypothetical protein
VADIALPATDRGADVERLATFLLACFPGKPLTVTVEPWKKERSSQQNKALFGHAYRVIRNETGADKDDLHRDFCIKFFGLKEQKVLCFERRQPVRTTTHDENGKRDVLPSHTFSEFYAMVEQCAAEFGIFIPAPNPRWFLDNENWSEAA